MNYENTININGEIYVKVGNDYIGIKNFNNTTNEEYFIDNKKPLVTVNKMYKKCVINDNISSIISFFIRYFDFEVDEFGFVCSDVSIEDDIEVLKRVKVNNKLLNVKNEVNSKNIIYFNPIVNLGTTRFLFELFLTKNNIDALVVYITDNVLYLKDFEGVIMYKSSKFEYNINLCYLDIIFRLCCIDVDLKRWDVDNYADIFI